ncbi:unnamed protein product [Notodromas monacha]|uniref:Transportin-3 n=1 Tax=Notodromas monacha TaxID=399045 RepID=A0A7R9BG34_9CRUS|nr:unnamed protein product [Notodromas monacha]CAG0914816.1 unnamed protein product [Notodromas monacha]
MDASPATDVVHQAILTLHLDPVCQNKEAANKWLTELQQSVVYAWKVADDLLHEKRDLLSCYFAAQTIRNKIQASFAELPVESHESLRISLLQHIKHITPETDHTITLQLSVAMADFALQMTSWENPLLDLISILAGDPPNPDGQHIYALLDVLKVLPEEITSRHLRLASERREILRTNFGKMFDAVVPFVSLDRRLLDDKKYTDSGGHHSSSASTQKAMQCLTSWFEFAVLPTQSMNFEPILQYAVTCLTDRWTPNMAHERAVECLCAAVGVFYGIRDHSDEHYVLARWVQEAAYTMIEPFNVCVAEEDIDKILGFARLFSDLADALTSAIIYSPGVDLGSLQTLEILLLCAGHFDPEVCNVTFNFWYNFAEVVHRHEDTHLTGLVKPYVKRLLMALRRLVEMEPDHEGILDEDTDSYDFRLRVSELVRDLSCIVSPTECSVEMLGHMWPWLETIRKREIDGSNPDGRSGWELIEACYFMMGTVGRLIPATAEVVDPMVDSVLSLPSNFHVAIRVSAISLLGEISHCFEQRAHRANEIFSFLLLYLNDPICAQAAASSLEKVSMVFRDLMGIDHLEVLFTALRSIDENNTVPRHNVVGVLVSIVCVASRLSPTESKDILREVVRYHVGHLSQHCTDGAPRIADPTMWLDRIAVIGRHMTSSVEPGMIHPCRDVVIEMWPVLDAVLTKYADDSRIMERTCRALRFLIRAVSKQCSELLTPLVPKLVEVYNGKRHSCLLYLGSILVDEFGRESEFQGGLLLMLEALLPSALELLKDADSRKMHPDTLDDLYRLCGRFVQRLPGPFLVSSCLPSVLEVALVGVLLDHKDVIIAIQKFWVDFIRIAGLPEDEDSPVRHVQLAKDILFEKGCGAQLVLNLILDVVGWNGFGYSNYFLAEFADVIYSLMSLDRVKMCHWLEAALKDVAVKMQATNGSIQITQTQLVSVHKAITSAEGIKTVVQGLKNLNRLFA